MGDEEMGTKGRGWEADLIFAPDLAWRLLMVCPWRPMMTPASLFPNRNCTKPTRIYTHMPRKQGNASIENGHGSRMLKRRRESCNRAKRYEGLGGREMDEGRGGDGGGWGGIWSRGRGDTFRAVVFSEESPR